MLYLHCRNWFSLGNTIASLDVYDKMSYTLSITDGNGKCARLCYGKQIGFQFQLFSMQNEDVSKAGAYVFQRNAAVNIWNIWSISVGVIVCFICISLMLPCWRNKRWNDNDDDTVVQPARQCVYWVVFARTAWPGLKLPSTRYSFPGSCRQLW